MFSEFYILLGLNFSGDLIVPRVKNYNSFACLKLSSWLRLLSAYIQPSYIPDPVEPSIGSIVLSYIHID